MKNFFNPTFTEMLEEYPNITIIGLFWAGIWRWYGLILVIAFAIGVLSAIFGNN